MRIVSNVFICKLLDPPGYYECLPSIWFQHRCCQLISIESIIMLSPAAVSVQTCYSVFMYM